MQKRIFIILLKYCAGLGLLGWVIWSNWHKTIDGEEVGLAGIFEGHRPFHVNFFLLATAVAFVSISLTFYRWYILVKAQGLPFTLLSAWRLGLVGFYLNSFLPGSVGGDIIKAAFLAREQSRRTVAVATVLLDRIIGLCGLLWLVAIAGSFFWATGKLAEFTATEHGWVLDAILLACLAFVAGSVVFWLLLGCLSTIRADAWAEKLERLPKVGRAVAELWRSVWMYRQRGRNVAEAMGLALIGHVGFVLVFYCCARTLSDVSEMPPLESQFLLVPMGMTFQAGFPTPSGLGGAEYGFGKLYELAGYSFTAGVLGLLVQRCIYWMLGLVGYIVYLRMTPDLEKSGTNSDVDSAARTLNANNQDNEVRG